MANIQKRGENSYRLTAFAGYDSKGKQIRKTKTVNLKEGMTEKQVNKELNRLSVLFDEEVEKGTYLDGERITLGDLCSLWLESSEKTLAPSTFNTYKTRIADRIIPMLGHIKLSKLQPHHLKDFYSNLENDGNRLDTRYSPNTAIMERLKKFSASKLSNLTGIPLKTCKYIKQGKVVTRQTAEKLSVALEVNFNNSFSITGKTKLTDKTIRHHHALLRSILNFAIQENLITSNPAVRVRLSKLQETEADYYDESDLNALCYALDSEPILYKILVYLAIDSGMRKGELVGLLWSDIDICSGYVKISRQKQYVAGHGIITREPKTSSAKRVLTLSATVTEMLVEYKEKQKKDFEVFGITWTENVEVFTNDECSPMSPNTPYSWFTKFLKRHNLKKITFHQLRHTNASLMIAAGVDMVTLANRLGHRNSNITQATYLHIIKSREKQAANVMDMFYNSKSKNVGS